MHISMCMDLMMVEVSSISPGSVASGASDHRTKDAVLWPDLVMTSV